MKFGNILSYFGLKSEEKNFRRFDVYDGYADFFSSLSHAQKIELALTSPALAKVILLQCDLFSLGVPYVYEGEKEIEKDPFLNIISRPNHRQVRQQFLWEVMFWLMIGKVSIYVDSNDNERLLRNKMYILNPYSLKFSEKVKKSREKIILSDSDIKSLNKEEVVYTYPDGTTFKFEYGKLIELEDIPFNFKTSGSSRIDALIKVIANSEVALDSLNINLKYSGKFLVAGKSDPNDINKLPLSDKEKEDIEYKMLKNKPVEAVKSLVDIKRFVENAGSQKLDEIYLNQYFIIGSMFNIPKDVLEAFNSGTYENQEKAIGKHISYSIQPKADLISTLLAEHFGYTEAGKNILLDWSYLPFMQVFEEQRAKSQYQKTQSLLNLLKAGVDTNDINKYLDVNFKYNGKQTEQSNSGNA